MTIEKIAILGLGYVGLPLAIEFGKIKHTIGIDSSQNKIDEYKRGCDPTGEVVTSEFSQAIHLEFSTDPCRLSEADIIIVAVPTPVDSAKVPDLTPLVRASTVVGKFLKRGAIVVFESTVYPGATEDVCIPVIEQASGLKWKEGFHIGYSPERVNPGDKVRTLPNIVKVVSGDDSNTLEIIGNIYEQIIKAGVHRVSSIKVAEASKVIENTQRDLNIALMNELAIIFDMMGIDTIEVLNAAGTKWNFLPFRPGLVGGHCIGVDPYYLTYKSQQLGYNPQIILAGRRINDGMPDYLAAKIVREIINSGGCNPGDKVILYGITFKENCSDLRNSKSVELIRAIESYGIQVFAHDPLASTEEALCEYGLKIHEWDQLHEEVKAVIVAVPHEFYLKQGISNLAKSLKPGGLFFDIKSAFDATEISTRGYSPWRL